jgi:hypothetical protein
MKQDDWRWGRGLDSFKVRYSEAKRALAEHQKFMQQLANIPGGVFGLLRAPPLRPVLGADFAAPLLGVTENDGQENS